VLLQAGVQVADVAYFIGEDAPKMTGTDSRNCRPATTTITLTPTCCSTARGWNKPTRFA